VYNGKECYEMPEAKGAFKPCKKKKKSKLYIKDSFLIGIVAAE